IRGAFQGELKMRIAKVIFVGSAAALLMTAPALARNAQTQKTDDQSTSSSCHAYQQAPDGSWEKLPRKNSRASRPSFGKTDKTHEFAVRPPVRPHTIGRKRVVRVTHGDAGDDD